MGTQYRVDAKCFPLSQGLYVALLRDIYRFRNVARCLLDGPCLDSAPPLPTMFLYP